MTGHRTAPLPSRSPRHNFPDAFDCEIRDQAGKGARKTYDWGAFPARRSQRPGTSQIPTSSPGISGVEGIEQSYVMADAEKRGFQREVDADLLWVHLLPRHLPQRADAHDRDHRATGYRHLGLSTCTEPITPSNHTSDNAVVPKLQTTLSFLNCHIVSTVDTRLPARVNTDAAEVTKDKVVPLLITIDPERDGPNQLKDYLEDWHPRMLGPLPPSSPISPNLFS
eukprot:1391134-Rhodomonas_salina.4